MSSTISAARAALKSRLDTAAADPTSALYQVQVTFGPPDAYEAQEVVSLLGVNNPVEDAAVLGPGAPRNEQYRLHVAIKVYNPAASSDPNATVTPLTVDGRGWALAEAVRETVHNAGGGAHDINLGGAVRWAFTVAMDCPNGVQLPIDDAGKRIPGFVIRIDVWIDCFARV